MRRPSSRDLPKQRQRVLLWVIALLLTQACASGGATGGGSGPRNVITQDQIGDPTNETALTIVSRLRPAWLRARSQPGLADGCVARVGTVCQAGPPDFAMVHLDDLVFGNIDALDGISGTQIERIEYLDALDATTRFGLGYTGGAIIVRTINSAR